MSESKTIDDGGFAFPQPETMQGNPIGCEVANAGGMSLRDYFAAKAIPGLVEGYDFEMREISASKERTGFDDHNPESIRTYAEQLAFDAYIIADAMLRVRQMPGVSV